MGGGGGHQHKSQKARVFPEEFRTRFISEFQEQHEGRGIWEREGVSVCLSGRCYSNTPSTTTVLIGGQSVRDRYIILEDILEDNSKFEQVIFCFCLCQPPDKSPLAHPYGRTEA